MSTPKFILSKKIAKEKVKILEDLGLKVSYSYKTNHEIGDVLQKLCKNVDFSIHAKEEIDMIKDKNKIWFFTQAETKKELENILKKGVKKFVIDNEIDLKQLLEAIKNTNIKINLSLRMKFQEHRVGTGKYFVYGMNSNIINKIISEIKENKLICKLGVHIHRKSQNTSEWDIKEELEDSLTRESLNSLDFLNLGGGLPSKYRSHAVEVLPYIFSKIKETINWLKNFEIETIIEPGRFIAASAVKLETSIIQIQGENLIINTTIYNCALDTILTETKMLIQGELEEQDNGKYYLIKGNSPTRDDIFRYKVKLKDPKIGDKVIFLNAGAYNYTTDFFGYKKLKTEIVEDFS
ncbi:MAG: decarboxylase [Nanoarchaeota archaeon]|nr:decarboxylase [Nanoarchaeota archaeon]MBU4339291.1 decarboxylase [Patescibacteria group bacterium]